MQFRSNDMPYRDMGRHAHLAPQRGGPCDRGPDTQGRVLRAMIETNRAELWAAFRWQLTDLRPLECSHVQCVTF